MFASHELDRRRAPRRTAVGRRWPAAGPTRCRRRPVASPAAPVRCRCRAEGGRARRRQGPAHRGPQPGGDQPGACRSPLLVLVLFAFALDPDRGIAHRAPRPACSGSPCCSALCSAVQRAFAVETADGSRDALRLSGPRPRRRLPRQGRRARRSSCSCSRSLLGVGVVVLYDAPTSGRRRRPARGRRRWLRPSGWPPPVLLRRPRCRAPGAGDPAPAAPAPGGGAGADRCHEGVRSGTRTGGAAHRKAGPGSASSGCSPSPTARSGSWPSDRSWRSA